MRSWRKCVINQMWSYFRYEPTMWFKFLNIHMYKYFPQGWNPSPYLYFHDMFPKTHSTHLGPLIWVTGSAKDDWVGFSRLPQSMDPLGLFSLHLFIECLQDSDFPRTWINDNTTDWVFITEKTENAFQKHMVGEWYLQKLNTNTNLNTNLTLKLVKDASCEMHWIFLIFFTGFWRHITQVRVYLHYSICSFRFHKYQRRL